MLRRRANSRGGFTLIEVVIALAIASLLGVGIVTLFRQVIMLNGAASGRMGAVKQVENALHYLNRDIQMASPFQSQLPSSSSDLTLRWTDFLDNNIPHAEHVVTYSTVRDGDLQRTETIGNVTQPVRIVASHVVSAAYAYDGDSVTVSLTVSFAGMNPVTETRSLEVKLRPSS